MIQKIITIPDERLFEICSPVLDVEVVDDIVRDLFDTCDSLVELDGRSTSCVGLAAPQIGIMKRIFVLNTNGIHQAFINPEITKRRGKLRAENEKCFSEPGVVARVQRFDLIEAKHLAGRIKLNGFAARVFQHEFDHLNGKLISRFVAKEFAA